MATEAEKRESWHVWKGAQVLCPHLLANSAPSGSCLADPSPQPTAHVGAGSTQDAPAGPSVTALLRPEPVPVCSSDSSTGLGPPRDREAACDPSGAQPGARLLPTGFTPTRAGDQPPLTLPSKVPWLPLSGRASLDAVAMYRQHFLPLLKSCSYLHFLLPPGLISTALI